MSKWTHAICRLDWNERNPDRLFSEEQDGQGDLVPCCYCGRLTASGIYVRDNPNGPMCGGNGHVHEGEER